ncbi:hydro-lyase, Fe-S type, tartrate/fumarate subfamily, beta subunit [Pyrolobus fumarii 1A]|uniref:Hydro-lyase, Fe-S type, tartrate/fumarate subfamily, beta subunit n=1 Tax=Pyrolobus fumarii (strain DSM 11204 / 1A) TaxID=694429 RepID=G0EF10_PYRF1|nr:FumA C-terminus/TtdB family hydratase beta subunit [Pyrolobus fumarii]AEM38907.1 hydro-lyase, Fe-S type, tartrate/fumarate subfamily, beta subunit [Pyrolobus fumarii 1A]
MGNVYHIRLPASREDIEKLRVGDTVYLTGIIVTARDQAHRRILELVRRGEKLPIDLKGLAIYHCGPVVKREGSEWRVIAAGPTTSYRMGMLVAEVVKATGAAFVIGKGGLPSEAAKALAEAGGVYLAFPGGAGALAATRIKSVAGVYWLEELGVPEALWVFEVEEFGPMTVAVDVHGGNLYEDVRSRVSSNAAQAKRRLIESLAVLP